MILITSKPIAAINPANRNAFLRGRWRGSRQKIQKKAIVGKNRDGQTDQMPPVLTIRMLSRRQGGDDHLRAEPAMEVMDSVMIKSDNNPISEIKTRGDSLSQIFSRSCGFAPQTSRDWARIASPQVAHPVNAGIERDTQSDQPLPWYARC